MINHQFSKMATGMLPSEIVRLSGVIKEKIAGGAKIYNYTIGDFDSKQFPIPKVLEAEIINAYNDGYTTYPAAEGEMVVRQAVGHFLKTNNGIDYAPGEILISNGGRPLIYALFKTLVNAGDKVIYPVPSWNNNHYTFFNDGEHAVIDTTAETNFLPTAAQIKPLIEGARLLCLCSPLNPTGTAFSKEALEAICDLVLEENNRRGEDEQKLYVMYDQIYWTLTLNNTAHYCPVGLRPAMKDYTIYVDGISKAFAATGVRVGWSLGPQAIIAKMKALNSHIGSWAPMAEQHAVAKFLNNHKAVHQYLAQMKEQVSLRLNKFYNGFQALKSKGYSVDAIAPQAAIYLTVQVNLVGQKDATGNMMQTQEDVTNYLLDEAQLALVPFKCFGKGEESSWYRLSIGCCAVEDIDKILGNLERTLEKALR